MSEQSSLHCKQMPYWSESWAIYPDPKDVFYLSPDLAAKNGLVSARDRLASFIAKACKHKDYPDLHDKGHLAEMARKAYPPGYFYIEKTKLGKNIWPGEKAISLIRLVLDVKIRSAGVLPFLEPLKCDNMAFVPSIWHILSHYDVIPLIECISFLAAETLHDSTFEEFASWYEWIFNLMKRKMLNSELHVPYGADIFTNTTVRPYDLNNVAVKHSIMRQKYILIDRKSFFRFLICDSGLSPEILPGAILSAYQRDVEAEDKSNIHESIDGSSDDVHDSGDMDYTGPIPADNSPERRFDSATMITIKEMQEISRKSRKWIDGAIEDSKMSPCFISKIASVSNGFWRHEAMIAMHAKKNKRA